MITYAELLDVFWASHSPTGPNYSEQYKSAIFVHDKEQRAAAEKSKAAQAQKVYTEIHDLAVFYRAEDYHQKYRLRGNAKLMSAFRKIYENDRAFVDSTDAMRVNAYLAGYLKRDVLVKDLDERVLGALN